MKQKRQVSSALIAIVMAGVMGLNASGRAFEVLHMVDLHFPDNLVSYVPDVKTGAPGGVWSAAFVFSAQNTRDGKFDLHCKYMTAEDISSHHLHIEECFGEPVVTGCVRAVISQTPCYSAGFILDCAKERTNDGQYSHCDMYLLRRDGKKIKPLSFAKQANSAGIFPGHVEESLFCSRESNSLAKVLVFRRDVKSNGESPVWSIVEVKMDLNSFSNTAERVLMSYESDDPRGLSM